MEGYYYCVEPTTWKTFEDETVKFLIVMLRKKLF